MKLEIIFKACNQICLNLLEKHPDREVSIPEGKVGLIQLSKELENLCSWCYKGDIDVQKIVKCKNCRYYRRYKKKTKDNPYAHNIIVLCSRDKIPRKPDFYCANGEEKNK